MITDPHDPRQFRRYVQVNADGSVTIPEVLRPYLHGRDRITKSEGPGK